MPPSAQSTPSSNTNTTNRRKSAINNKIKPSSPPKRSINKQQQQQQQQQNKSGKASNGNAGNRKRTSGTTSQRSNLSSARSNATNNTNNSKNSTNTKSNPWSSLEDDLGTNSTPAQIQARFRTELSKARSTGRLALKDMGLTSPLPNAMFDLRSGLTAANGNDTEKSWESYGEEMLISLDLSENDLSASTGEPVDIYASVGKGNGTTSTTTTTTASQGKNINNKNSPRIHKTKRASQQQLQPKNNKPTPVTAIPGLLDERIGCYVSLRTLRVKRCKLTKLPWNILQDELTSLVILDASDNALDAFQLERMPPSLSTLDISRNKISSLTLAGEDQDDDQIIDLPNLTHFDANSNQLKSLPYNINAPILQHLFISQNKLEALSPHPSTSSSSSTPSTTPKKTLLQSCQKTLQTLYAPENSLQSCPNLDQHVKLQVVELRMNQLKKTPSIHANLIRLDLNNNQITSIEGLYPLLDKYPTAKITEDATAAAAATTTTDETKTTTTAAALHKDNIDDGWYRTNIKELHLQGNNLESTLHDATISVMTKLTFLDVSHNDLDKVPIALGYLPNVRRIALDGNPLRNIRHSVKYGEDGSVDTDKLKQSMRLKGLPPPGPGYLPYEGDGGADGRPSTTQKLKDARSLVRKSICGERKLDMTNSAYTGDLAAAEILTALGEEVRDTASSTTKAGTMILTWDLSNNATISTIGREWLDALTNISVLDVTQNKLTALPENLHERSIRTLLCGRNQLSSMSVQRTICVDPVSDMAQKLEHLDLSANQLEWVPDGLFALSSLRTLNLSHNKIKDLTWEKQDDEEEGETAPNRGWKHGLVALVQLDLSNNQIADLGFMPLALSGCKGLRILQLNNNNLDDIPLELGCLKQLTTINLAGNPQNSVRTSVLSESCEVILEYLFNKMDSLDVSRVEEQHRAIEVALVSPPDSESGEGEGGESGPHVDTTTSEGQNTTVENDESPTLEWLEEQTGSDAASVSDEERLMQKENSIRGLKLKIEDMSERLEQLSLSQSKRNDLKTSLAMNRSQLIREEKELTAASS